MASWNLCEARLRQRRCYISPADSNTAHVGPVPAGKIWVVLAVGYFPSVAETQTISFNIYDANNTFGFLNPLSMALNPARATCIEQGMELMMWPGEFLSVVRADHTVGSTMSLSIDFVEIDLPLYTYDEPQVVKRHVRALSGIRTRLSAAGGGRGGGGNVAPGGGPEGGGKGHGGPLPI